MDLSRIHLAVCWVRNIEEIKNYSLQTWKIIKLNDWKSLWSFFDNLKNVKEVVLSEKTDARVAKNYLNKAFKAHTAQNVGNVTKWCELSGNAKCFEKLRKVTKCCELSECVMNCVMLWNVRKCQEMLRIVLKCCKLSGTVKCCEMSWTVTKWCHFETRTRHQSDSLDRESVLAVKNQLLCNV